MKTDIFKEKKTQIRVKFLIGVSSHYIVDLNFTRKNPVRDMKCFSSSDLLNTIIQCLFLNIYISSRNRINGQGKNICLSKLTVRYEDSMWIDYKKSNVSQANVKFF